MRAQKAGASGDDCPRPWHDYYRGDTEWKGKLVLWRGHGISNTSWGPSPPTPTKSLSEGHVLQIAVGPQKVADQLRCANAAKPTDLFGSERLRRLQFDGDVYELTERQPQLTATLDFPVAVLGGELSLRDNAGEAGMVAPRRVHAISISRTPIS